MKTLLFHLLLGLFSSVSEGLSVNVALNKPTTMSTGAPAYFAVDGKIDTEWPNVITTKVEGYSWWRVDLQTKVTDALVSLYFRTDSTHRRNGVHFYTSHDPTNFKKNSCFINNGKSDGSDIPDIVNMTCKGTWRYLTIFTDTDNGDGPDLDFAEVQVISSNVNVALNKPAIMSSGFASIAEKAVDGDLSTTWPDVIDTSTRASSSWWRVDLTLWVTDGLCVIYFRTDYKYRRNGVRLYTSDSPKPEGELGELGDLCHVVRGRPDGSDIPDVVRQMCPGQWRYLTIYTETDNGDGPNLDFGEVQVLDCIGETYGDDCSKHCSARMCKGIPTTCNRLTGACPSGGCMDGWQGQDCAQEIVGKNEVRQTPDQGCLHLSVEMIALIAGGVGVVTVLAVVVGVCVCVRYRRLPKDSPSVKSGTSNSEPTVAYSQTRRETLSGVYSPNRTEYMNSYSTLDGDTRMRQSDMPDYDSIKNIDLI